MELPDCGQSGTARLLLAVIDWMIPERRAERAHTRNTAYPTAQTGSESRFARAFPFPTHPSGLLCVCLILQCYSNGGRFLATFSPTCTLGPHK